MKRGQGLKRGKGLERGSSQLKRGEGLKRSTRVKPKNAARLKKRRAAQFGIQAELCRSSPCLVCGTTPCDPAHVKSRGAGGKDRDTVALCRAHHDEQHAIGVKSFEAKHGLSLADEAWRMERLAYGLA